ncbi:hypothetical protein BFJ66_g8295 [Fusarium oxysporum f. sp. cepae]|uniref:Uncharacterized protein n=1 Tax=Fusarium oxysporum f. sp. cepae TaxID=396571 RepID=A0A3L6P1N4_FUSOX|nr:hypothetical protein BFJ65_g3956 [Fusarium oxysporum f. sp. cepae]RKK46918.1 hypothetical protein BFJ66_g8295 [Fusarium oxysporum f. sp. cepae]
MQARQQTDLMMPAQRLLGSAEYPLVTLATQELEEILEELNEIVKKYSCSRMAHDRKRYTDKMKWLSDASKIEELRERAQAMKSNLHTAITFRVSSMVDRGNVRQEVLFHRVTQQLTYYTQETHNISQTLPRLLQNPQPMPEDASTSLQPWTQGTKIHNKPEPPATEGNRVAESRTAPSANASTHEVPTISEESFVSVTTIQPMGTQTRLREGFAYFPDDIAGGVWPLLLIALRNKSSDSIEILLKLWKNILPSQGLSREIGYRLKTYAVIYPGTAMNSVINKALSFVQDWEEVIMTKVHIAAAEGGVLDALREQPWAIDELNEYGEAPIHVSIGNNNFEGLEQLIAANADINRQTGFGNTPLMRASYYGRDTMVKKLLGYSESRRCIGQSTAVGQTALHFAVQSGSATCVRLLLEGGASALKLNQLGETPMHRLAWGRQDGQQEIDEIIELLQAHGADIESKNRDGWTPMFWACAKGNVPVLKALVRAGGSLSAISSHRQGILHRAACSNNFDVVHCLAEQDLEDIDPQLRDLSQGETPLGSLTWIFGKYVVPSDPIPTPDQQKDFIKLYFDLLIRGLERHMLTLQNIQEAIEDRDPKTTTELLHTLIKRNEASFRQNLVDWYRGFIFYVSDGQWDHLKQAICDEYDETSEKAKKAAVARGKTMADPEMKEFF